MTDDISPLPWREITEDESIGGIECADGRQVAQVSRTRPIRDDLRQVERRANAAFIVRAVNSHDRLVAALQVLVDNGGIGPEDMFREARAALAAATS